MGLGLGVGLGLGFGLGLENCFNELDEVSRRGVRSAKPDVNDGNVDGLERTVRGCLRQNKNKLAGLGWLKTMQVGSCTWAAEVGAGWKCSR